MASPLQWSAVVERDTQKPPPPSIWKDVWVRCSLALTAAALVLLLAGALHLLLGGGR